MSFRPSASTACARLQRWVTAQSLAAAARPRLFHRRIGLRRLGPSPHARCVEPLAPPRLVLVVRGGRGGAPPSRSRDVACGGRAARVVAGGCLVGVVAGGGQRFRGFNRRLTREGNTRSRVIPRLDRASLGCRSCARLIRIWCSRRGYMRRSVPTKCPPACRQHGSFALRRHVGCSGSPGDFARRGLVVRAPQRATRAVWLAATVVGRWGARFWARRGGHLRDVLSKVTEGVGVVWRCAPKRALQAQSGTAWTGAGPTLLGEFPRQWHRFLVSKCKP